MLRSLLLAITVTTALPALSDDGTGALADPAAGDATHLRRFAIVAGSNFGGAGRATLRYAIRDARSVAGVLGELGGVAPDDMSVLDEPDVTQLMSTLQGFRPRMQASHNAERVELLFYYSGHSDEDGLLLGNERITYRELKAAIDELPADVRIIVLDSCSSGALTRLKGGFRRAPFLVDASSRVKGHAFLTSSSADEAAQESDRVGGSFFTHFFVSGLRGAADHSADGKVTLDEAYHYAFQETLRRTEQSAAGPQHASYDIRLVGTGDLVMTDLRSGAADLELGRGITGNVLVRTADGTLLAEVRKMDDRPRVLSVPPGRYQVRVEEAGRARGARVTLEQGQRVVVQGDQLDELPVERTLLRGARLGTLDALPQLRDPREATRLRETGHFLLWGGLGTTAFGVCCMVPAAPSLMIGMFVNGGNPFGGSAAPCIVAGGTCTVLSVLFAAFGLPLAYTGYNRLGEADALEEELASREAALYRTRQTHEALLSLPAPRDGVLAY